MKKKVRPSTPTRLTPQAVAKINAVEGIRHTPEMEADFARFEREGWPPEKRHAELKRKYGRAS